LNIKNYLQFMLNNYFASFVGKTQILKHGLRLTFSGLGSVTRTTGRVFLLVLHPISCKSDGYGRTFGGFFGLRIFDPN
jgi:hypothetical protein